MTAALVADDVADGGALAARRPGFVPVDDRGTRDSSRWMVELWADRRVVFTAPQDVVHLVGNHLGGHVTDCSLESTRSPAGRDGDLEPVDSFGSTL
jgi:hypothetical protein